MMKMPLMVAAAIAVLAGCSLLPQAQGFSTEVPSGERYVLDGKRRVSSLLCQNCVSHHCLPPSYLATASCSPWKRMMLLMGTLSS
jgi:hypothetical protein